MDPNKHNKQSWIQNIDQETIGIILMWFAAIVFIVFLTYIMAIKYNIIAAIIFACIAIFNLGYILYITSY